MAVDFRCEQCGKPLRVEAEPGSKVRCPHCGARVRVPEGLASLPHPQVPPDAAPPPAQEQEQTLEEQAPAEGGSEALMQIMASVMPWIISAFFHVGVLVIMAFITIVVAKARAKPQAITPIMTNSEKLDQPLDAPPENPEIRPKSLDEVSPDQWAPRDSTIPMSSLGHTENPIPLYGLRGGAVGRGDFGLFRSSGKPRARFYGLGGSAYHIVYLVDRSGSMLESFDLVRKELLRSISRLSEQQTFHVIFFNDGDPVENGPRRLVPATTDYKREAAANLMKIQAFSKSGVTDPIPAIKRAFEVLSRVRSGKKQKLIYLLTDGEFQNNEKVRKTIRALNKDGQVHVNTILYVVRNPEFEQFLRQIAQENGGKFKFVERDE